MLIGNFNYHISNKQHITTISAILKIYQIAIQKEKKRVDSVYITTYYIYMDYILSYINLEKQMVI